MKAIAEIQILPIGNNVSVREEVEQANRILDASGLKTEIHSMGTDIEGELDEVFRALKCIHEQLHHRGVGRLSTVIKLGTRGEEETRAKRTLPYRTRKPDREPSRGTLDSELDSADSFVTVWQIASPLN